MSFKTLQDKYNHVRRGKCRPISRALKSYGDEKIQHILVDKSRMDSYVRAAYKAIPRMVEDVYFDNTHPENMTVRSKNSRSPYIEVYVSGTWELKPKKEVLDDLISSCADDIEEHLDKGESNAPVVFQEKCREALEKYFMENDGSVRKRITDDVLLTILNSSKRESGALFRKGVPTRVGGGSEAHDVHDLEPAPSGGERR